MQYGYDAYGRMASITYPSGRIVNYSYRNGRVSSLTLGATQSIANNIAYFGFAEAFDREFLVLVEDETQGRFIWIDERSREIRETTMNHPDYLEPIGSFCEWWYGTKRGRTH